jgi:hypothetical protein
MKVDLVSLGRLLLIHTCCLVVALTFLLFARLGAQQSYSSPLSSSILFVYLGFYVSLPVCLATMGYYAFLLSKNPQAVFGFAHLYFCLFALADLITAASLPSRKLPGQPIAYLSPEVYGLLMLCLSVCTLAEVMKRRRPHRLATCLASLVLSFTTYHFLWTGMNPI